MKHWKKRICYIVLTFILLLSAVYYLLVGSLFVNWNNDRLGQALSNIDAETVTLEELVPFAWDAVYEFDPYTSREEIATVIGFNSFEIKESVSDHVHYLFFVKGNRIVSNPRNSSATLGCYISLPHWKRDNSIGSGNCYLEYGDNVLFEIATRNGAPVLQPVDK